MADDSAFRLCSSCRKPIPYLSAYYACSVSTCNRKRTGLYFCSVACWDAHLPEARHREAWAEERRAPSREEAAREDAGDDHIGATPGAGADAPARQRERIEGGLSREGDPRRAASVAAMPSVPATASEVTPVRSVDRIEVGNGRRGPITTQIQQRFLDIARGAVDDPYGWLTYVRAERESGRAVET